MIPLKEDDTFAVLSDDGGAGPGSEHGAAGYYRHDTRFLSTYRWRLPGFTLASSRPAGACLQQRWERLTDDGQPTRVHRKLRLMPGGFEDRLALENAGPAPQEVPVALEVDADFADLFELRGGWGRHPAAGARRETLPDGVVLHHEASDGVRSAARLTFDPPAGGNRWTPRLAPGERTEITVMGRLESTLDRPDRTPLPEPAAWRARFAARFEREAVQSVFDQAVDDLRALLLATPQGLYPAAGIPWFVTPFGRDGLITAIMCLPWEQELAAGVLRYAAATQGTREDPYREEQPGKIFHEARSGEWSRTGKVPFARYYGTADATPLFLMLLDRYVDWTGDTAMLRALEGRLRAALGWICAREEAGNGWIHFQPAGGGLAVQSWKDSADSLSHAGGSLAEPPVAVSEVQGYAYAAYRAAARCFDRLGDATASGIWQDRGSRLRHRFHEAFWLEDLGTYALAIDASGRPLRVLASDAGHLLWSGIVPDAVAPRLVQTLMSPPLWSGWGLRTLGIGERRYDPISYHNGSVWPHDTAIFAGGLARYGFRDALATVAEALVSLAQTQPDRRLPELIAGHARGGAPPVSYHRSCRPQAWSAAALPYVVSLVWGMAPGATPRPPGGLLAGRQA